MIASSVPILLFEEDRTLAQQLIQVLSKASKPYVITHHEKPDSLHHVGQSPPTLIVIGLPSTTAADQWAQTLSSFANVPVVLWLEQTTTPSDFARISTVHGTLFKHILDADYIHQTVQLILEKYNTQQKLHEAQDKLIANEHRFRNIITNNSDGIIVIDRQGFIRFINPATAALFNRDTSQLLYTPFGFPLAPNETSEIDIIRNPIETRVAEMRVVETEWEGEAAYVASLRDVTERYQNEEQFRLLASAIAQINDSVVITTIKTDTQMPRIVFVNPAFTTLSGYPQEEVIGQPPHLLQRLETDRGILDFLYQHPIRKTYFRGETTNYRKDGREYFMDWQITTIDDENQHHQFFVAIQRDVTERHRAEVALRKSEATFRALFEAASEGILISDIDGKILHINQQMEILFGYTTDELIGKPIEILVPERFRDNHLHFREQYTHNPYIRQMGSGLTLYGQRKDGTEFAIEISLSYVDGEELLLMAFIQDITERLQAQQERLETELLRVELIKERELHELKNRFISTITHEFRTPLAVIQTASDLLQTNYDKLSEENREKYFSRIRVYLDNLNSMVDDVFTLNQAQMGRVRTNPTLFALTPFCHEIANIFDLYKPSTQHEFSLTIETAVEQVYLDKDLLYHILTNLLSNAIKYSPDGGELQLHVSREPDSYIFRLRDHGIGIPQDEHKRIFEAFHRGRNVGNISGTGLGLAIVKNYLDLQKGTIEVDSDEQAGTTMTVRLPILLQ